jgi:hypothetical protein
MLRRSRIAELNALVQRTLALDPGNPLVINFAVFHLYRAQQPQAALQADEYGHDAFPELYAALRSYVLFDFAGRTQEMHSYFDRYAPMNGPVRPGEALAAYFALLRHEHRYAELRALIDRVPVASGPYLSGVDFGPVGPTPTALFRGWADLLLGDRAAAAHDGQAVLRFVHQQARSNWNAVHLQTLTAAGYLFTGDCARAQAAGKAAITQAGQVDNALSWNSMAMQVARVNAWCGDGNGAIALLTQVSVRRPGVGPAGITRDPLFTVPLGQLPAYRALAEQLEVTIRTTRLQ